MDRRKFLQDAGLFSLAAFLLPACGSNPLAAPPSPTEPTAPLTPSAPAPETTPALSDREYWVEVADRIVRPVFSHLASRQLRLKMPVETAPGQANRILYTHLEAFGRSLAGIAPWLKVPLSAGEENDLRNDYIALTQESMDSATDPASPDFMNFTQGTQPLVDAAYVAHALLRAPEVLWNPLEDRVKQNVISALKATRTIQPFFNNWLLFSATVEAALAALGEAWDPLPVEEALNRHEEWYKGDGTYGDGPPLHWDYYNSFVIHPMLIDVLEAVGSSRPEWTDMKGRVLTRARRYAEILERLISPEGTFPSIGRSTPYRFGAFQLLGQMALRHDLPLKISPAQVRSALTAIIRRQIEVPETFNADGWLQLGFAGHQPDLAEFYISTGSLYLCTLGLLPLGLSPEDPFWAAPPEDWTQKKIWAGQNMAADHAL